MIIISVNEKAVFVFEANKSNSPSNMQIYHDFNDLRTHIALASAETQ